LRYYKINLLLFLISFSIVPAQNGVVKSYFPNKNIKSELSYVNDILDGSAKYFHENGNLKLEQNFSRGILNGRVKEFYSNGITKEEYFVKDGVLDGDKKLYTESGQLKELISYINGVALQRKTFETDQEITFDSSTEKENQKVVTTLPPSEKITMAVPVGGIEAVQSKVFYPEHAIKFGLEGKVELLVTIDENGNVVKTNVTKGIGLGCDEAAVEAVSQSKFIASTKNEIAVITEIPLSIEFKIPKQQEKLIANQEPVSNPAIKFEEHLSVICEADRCPRPEDDLETIYSRFETPTVAIALKLRGMIIIEGIVDKEGNLKQTKIIDGIGYGCDQLVENSLKKSKFNPAIKKGEPVEAKIVLSFPFSYDW